MTFDVTSWFISQCEYSPPVVRKFWVGSTDYSEYVTRWPSIKRTWNDVRPVSASISLDNTGKTFNFFHSDPSNLMGSAALQMGLTHPSSGDELITLLTGKIERVRLSGKKANITITDKTKPFSELQLGNNETPLDYTGSSYLPSDLVWYWITSYGGFDTTPNGSNVDIDYTAFSTWAGVFSGDNVRMKAYLSGMKITEALRKVARITRSAIFIKDNKLSFHRFSLADSHQTDFDYTNLIETDVTLDDKTVTNRQFVLADYSITSKSHNITCVSTDGPSVNSYGIREETEEDSDIWYVDSISALNLAQRVIFTEKYPYSDFTATCTMGGIVRQIGETMILTDEFFGESAEAYRILSNEINIHTGQVKIGCNATQILSSFRLDYSSLDSSDALL